MLVLKIRYFSYTKPLCTSKKQHWIYQNTKDKIHGYTRLAQWHEKVVQSGFKSFNTISRTIMNHYVTIIKLL